MARRLSLYPALFILVLLAGCHKEPPQVVDVNVLAGKTPEEVAQILGPPTSQAFSARRELGRQVYESLQRYNHGTIDVLYREGRADAFVLVYPRGKAWGVSPFAPATVRAAGLEVCKPIEMRENERMRWENQAGFRQIILMAHPVDGGAAMLMLDGYTAL